jgi:DMSO/TMAO reductase YedYZ molybdopterin-dependent catalytic subunit
VYILAPLQILTGAAMSPSVVGRVPWYPPLFGGRQAARTLHFAGLCAFAAFVVVHTAMVIIHGVGHEFAAIVLTSYDADHALALAVGGAGLLVIVLVNAAATVFSLRRPRAAQRLTAHLVDPVERLLVHRLQSRQHYSHDRISPFFRVNGHPPADEGYRALAHEGFRDYRLTVTGLVAEPLELSLGDLRALGTQRQITLHNCIQGWTNVAEWSGVPLAVVLARCRPRAEARYVVFHALDDKGQTEGEGRFGHFYGTLPLSLARRPQTILALDMNGRPLPVEHGAPVRLRVESQLGFKMVKWIGAIELIEDYGAIGMGMGGWREDQQYYTTSAGI